LRQFVYLIAFGGNVGDRVQCAHGSLSRLSEFGTVGRQSAWKYTEPLRSDSYETSDHGEYLNFVFEFMTSLRPLELYNAICMIEDEFGHDRIHRWRPRAVDLDILLMCSFSENSSGFQIQRMKKFSEPKNFGLCIPHPALWQREFLLQMIRDDLQIKIDKENMAECKWLKEGLVDE